MLPARFFFDVLFFSLSSAQFSPHAELRMPINVKHASHINSPNPGHYPKQMISSNNNPKLLSVLKSILFQRLR
jgi:hypothetical protein